MKPTDSALADCPFCGMNAKTMRYKGGYRVCCESIDCLSEGPVDLGEHEAIAAWNRRAALSPERRREVATKINAAIEKWRDRPSSQNRSDVIYDALTEAMGGK